MSLCWPFFQWTTGCREFTTCLWILCCMFSFLFYSKWVLSYIYEEIWVISNVCFPFKLQEVLAIKHLNTFSETNFFYQWRILIKMFWCHVTKHLTGWHQRKNASNHNWLSSVCAVMCICPVSSRTKRHNISVKKTSDVGETVPRRRLDTDSSSSSVRVLWLTSSPWHVTWTLKMSCALTF